MPVRNNNILITHFRLSVDSDSLLANENRKLPGTLWPRYWERVMLCKSWPGSFSRRSIMPKSLIGSQPLIVGGVTDLREGISDTSRASGMRQYINWSC